MAFISRTGLSAYAHDAWASPVSHDRVDILPVWCFRLYSPYPCRAFQHRDGLDGMVLAALSGQMGRVDRRAIAGRLTVHALLWALRSQRVVYGRCRTLAAVWNTAIS